MKNLITILLLLMTSNLFATTYYVSNAGSDANNGTSPSTAWATIGKVNSTTFIAGDIISFHGGDTFYGEIIVSNSGNSGNPITYNSYGSGNATITGFTDVTAWTNTGTNLWTSTSAVTGLGELRMVVISNKITAMGRTPNAGWYHYGSGSTSSSLVSTDMPSTPNWVGAGLVVHMQQWQYDRGDITSQSGSTIGFTNQYPGDNSWSVVNGNGFFIQDDPRTLDQQNEWYFDKSTQKLQIYSTSSPTNVKVSNKQYLVYDTLQNYIEFHNLTFTGSEDDAIHFGRDNVGCKVRSCNVSYAGGYGIYFLYGTNNLIDSNEVSHTVYTGIYGGGNNLNAQYNYIHDIGEALGLAVNCDYDGIHLVSNTGTIIGNRVQRVGANGIGPTWTGSTLIQYNFVDSAVMLCNDHSAMYFPGDTNHKVMDHNIVLHTLGYNEDKTTGLLAEGLYVDDNSKNKVVTNNTSAFNSHMGLKLHGGTRDTIRNNTVFANPDGFGLAEDGAVSGQVGYGNLQINGNISVGLSGQYPWYYRVDAGHSLSAFGNVDSNYIGSPTPATAVYSAINYSGSGESLASWQSNTGNDLHSVTAPQTYADADVKFVYNASFADSTISLGNTTYQDIKGTQYNSGSIVIHPFESAVLFKTGTTTTAAPTVNVSGSQQISTTSTTIYSTVTAASGQTISSIIWTDITGSGTATIVTPNSENTDITNLSAGTHTFQIKVTQSDGQVTIKTVSITVTLTVLSTTTTLKIHKRLKPNNR